jgi:hypothetical protein
VFFHVIAKRSDWIFINEPESLVMSQDILKLDGGFYFMLLDLALITLATIAHFLLYKIRIYDFINWACKFAFELLLDDF